MHQQQLDNATTTTQQCNNNYSTNAATTTTQQCNNNYSTMQQQQLNNACGTNRATAPFTKVIIGLVRLQPPSLKSYSTCQATAPFAKVIFDLSGYNPLRLTILCNDTT